VTSGEQVPVLIRNAQRTTLDGGVHNGNITFENFRKKDDRTCRTC
jgi:hypothetical protein